MSGLRSIPVFALCFEIAAVPPRAGMGWEAEDQEGVNFSVIDFHPILLRLGREGASDIVPSWSREIDEGKIIEHLLIYRIRFITRLLKLREHEVLLVKNSS